MEAVFERQLGIPVRLCVARKTIEMAALSLKERAQYDQLATPSRRNDWLLGRSALKALLARLGRCSDTASVTFPNPCYSLTHCDGFAAAVGVPPRTLEGIGVDLETSRTPHPRAAGLFLTPHERAWLERLGSAVRGRELRRLWTVKEAVFKSDPANRGRSLMSYELVVPGAKFGVAAAGPSSSGRLVRYGSLEFGRGFLSIAAMPPEKVSRWWKN